LVLDTGLEQVQRFDGAGKLLATYTLEGLAGLEVLDLAVSSDGQTLFVVDAASKRLQVITLTDDVAAGEEE
jgi:DNA-binding beta-propeller fold protein YncE